MDRRTYDDYVRQVVCFGNLTKAAGALGISQPALTTGLNTLEKNLGFRIFDRKHNPITLTPQGEIYYDYIGRMQVLAEDFSARINALNDAGAQSVSIGGAVAYTETLITDAVVQLRREYPSCMVSIKTASLPELVDMASTGEINCFISTSDAIPPRFQKQFVKNEKIYLCIPSDYPVNRLYDGNAIKPGQEGPMVDFSMLSGLDFIFLEKEMPLQQNTLRFLSREGIQANSFLTVNQVSTALNFACRGEGICFATEEALLKRENLDSVCIYALPKTLSGRFIYLAYDPQLYRSPVCKRLMEIITHYEEKDVQP